MKLKYILALFVISILVGCTTQVVIQQGEQKEEGQMTTKQSGEGTAEIGAISPGQILHLGIHTDQTRGLWVINTDGSNLHKVLNEYVNAKWSPDNKLIAYVSADLWIMNADGSTKSKVGRASMGPIGEFYWSSNGKYIVYEHNGVAIADVAKKDETQIITAIGTKISSPTWSDDDRVAFISGKEIKKVNIDGTSEVTWLSLNSPSALKASPDKTKLAFSDNSAFWIAADERDTSDMTKVTDSTVSTFEWSPDSQLIVYEASGKMHIYDVVEKEEVASFAGHNEDRFTWSRDSKWIAFTQKKSGAAEDIWVVNANGAGLKEFTNCPTACENPDWSH